MVLRRINRIGFVAALIFVSPIFAPRLLAFPYSAIVGQHRVYSDTPLDPTIRSLVAKADAAVARSPLHAARASDQSIYLTNGGWRWIWLAPGSRGTFAISRPFIESIVANRSDVARDVVRNGGATAGQRSLHGTLAHEMTHGLIRAHFGVAADWRYPAELREGYCDYVAGGGSLSDGHAQRLLAEGRTVPALTYWRGRKKVEAALATNHGNVDALFANWRS